MVKSNEQAIREAAYFIWQDAGCPQGQDEYFWTMAVEQFSNKSSSKSSSTAAKKTSVAKKSSVSACKPKANACKSSSAAKKSSK